MTARYDFESLYIFGEASFKEDRAKLTLLPGKRVFQLDVHIERPSDVEFVASCKVVEHLTLRSWAHLDLSPLKGLAAKYVHLVGGRQTSVRGLNTKRLNSLWVHACGKLRELGVAAIPHVRIWACNNLDLDCLAKVRGLVGLDIGMRRVINSLAFVGRCRALRFLHIDTRSMKTRDFRPLVEAPALELAAINGMKRADVEATSKANRKLLIWAEGCCMLDGNLVTKEDYLKRRKALNNKYRV